MFLTTLALPQTIRTLLVHTLLVTDLFASLAHLDITTALAKEQKPSAEQLLQYTSQGHVLGFGKSRVVIAAKTHALTINLVGAKKVDPVSEETDHDLNNSQGRSASPLTMVSYKHPWPGVTVCYRSNKNAIVKSDYHLEAGQIKKGLSKIRLNYNRPIKLDKQGRLVIEYGLGSMQESRPIAWQEIEGRKKSVEAHFVKQARQTIGFSASGYDERYPLIIDPELTWNTFLGRIESDTDYGYAVSADTSGNVYIGGSSDGTWGSPERVYTEDNDAFVAKLDASGNLVWNTFLGGSGYDKGYAIAVDPSGNVLVGGTSNAGWGSPQRVYSAGEDAFVAKLDSGGNLLWNTFLGGGSNDYGRAIAVDTSGNVLVGGYSDTTWGSPQRAYTAGEDAFVAKLDASGTLLWNTFLGGSDTDYGYEIALDTSGNVLIGGTSYGSWGSPQRAYTQGFDAFVAKLDASGTLLWNTFLGGYGTDYGHAIAVDTSGNVLVAGESTLGWSSPQRPYTDRRDAFIAKLDSNGALLWNTFLGSTGDDYGNAIATDTGGNVLVGGESSTSWGSPQRAYTGVSDAFAAKLDPSGTLLWNTFLGGSGSDYGNAIATDNSGNVLFGGYSNGSWGSPQQAYSGGNDVIVAKLDSSANLLWNTFLGGSGSDSGRAIAVDPSGNVVIGGTSYADWSSPQRAYSGGTDAFVAKLDSSGNLIWNTFLGGTSNDSGNAIAVDPGGNVFVGGESNAGWGSPQRAYSSGSDVFAAKLDSSGTLLWNTFLGGTSTDYGTAIAVDLSGNVLVGGYSDSSWGSPKLVYSGEDDAFVAKLDPSGTLLWNCFLGGSSTECGHAIAVDTTGNVVIGGTSDSSWGSPQRAYTNFIDAFVAKLDPSGTLLWNTFLGGGSNDYSRAIAVDLSGNVLVGGHSATSWGSPQRGYTDVYDAFVAKLDDSGTLLWNTFLGGYGIDNGDAIAVDSVGNILAAGESTASWGSPQRAYTGSYDAFAAWLDSSGTLLWNTFLGGSAVDYGYAIAMDNIGNVLVAGLSSGTWGTPVSPYMGSKKAFAAKISDLLPVLTPTCTVTVIPTSVVTASVTPDFFKIYTPLVRLSRNEILSMGFQLQQAGMVKVSIYDIMGRQVFDLAQYYNSGPHDIEWDGSGAGSGTYLVYFDSPNHKQRGKIVFVR